MFFLFFSFFFSFHQKSIKTYLYFTGFELMYETESFFSQQSPLSLKLLFIFYSFIFIYIFSLYNVMTIWQDKCDAVKSPLRSSAVFHPFPPPSSRRLVLYLSSSMKGLYFSSHSFTVLEKKRNITSEI